DRVGVDASHPNRARPSRVRVHAPRAAIGTLMFVLLPALQASRMTLTEALHGQMSGALRGARLRSALVVGQVAVSLVLVIAALTLARNGAAVGAIDLGFQTHGVMSIPIVGGRGFRADEDGVASRVAIVSAATGR